MPWKVFKDNDKYVVRKLNADGEPIGDPLGTHDTEADATAQQRALYASENSKAAVKFADAAETEIEGLLAPHGGPFNGRDVAGEFFSANTDFVLDWYEGDRPLIWQHGLDAKTGVAVVGRVKSLSRDELGLWMKAQLDAANEYYEAIKELIKAGKVGLSSGSMRHLVVTGKSGEILRWPLIEGSLTPTPCNPLAEVDFASAEKHYEAAGIKADLSALKLDSADVPESATGKKMKPDQMRQMVKGMADKAEVDMSDSEMERMIGEMADMDEAEAEAHAKKQLDKMADDGKKSAALKSMSGSYEHLIECLNGLVNPYNPFGMSDRWAYIEATFVDYFIVKQFADGECCYWRVEYTTGEDGCPKLGKMEQVEETYVPKQANGDEMPMANHAEMTKAFAAGLVERTKDLRERRIKEGRIISTSNRRKLGECLTSMRAACDEMQALLDSTEPQPAKAASVRRQIQLLGLYAHTLN